MIVLLSCKKTKPGNLIKQFTNYKRNSLNEEDEYKLMQYIKEKIFLNFSEKVDRLVKFKVSAF